MARYDEMQSCWLLPVIMRAEAFNDGVADVVDMFGADVSEMTRDYSVWNAIDRMNEAQIDALADELNILWYDKLASLESKRGVVKNCKHIQAKLGTKWALEEILNLYYSGDTVVTEWFDYPRVRGDPNHFTIETEYTARTDAETRRFMTILNKVKRKSAILDKVYAVISSNATVEAGAWLHSFREDDADVTDAGTYAVIISNTEWRGHAYLQDSGERRYEVRS